MFQELELYDNQITTIENLDGLVNLRMLDVSHNRLRYLGAGQSEDAGCLHNILRYLGAGQSEDAECLSQQTQVLGCWSI